jgi:hypothetical protein
VLRIRIMNSSEGKNEVSLVMFVGSLSSVDLPANDETNSR